MNSETKEIYVGTLVNIIGVVAMVWVSRKLTQPDFGRMVKMRMALQIKRLADGQVMVWQRVASNAATSYNKARV